MLRNDLIKNKIYGIIFIILGALTIPIEWDMDKLKEDLWVYGGVRLEEVEGK